MADEFEFKGTFDASDIIAGAKQSEDAVKGLQTSVETATSGTQDLSLSLISQFEAVAKAITGATQTIQTAFESQAAGSSTSLRKIKTESEGVFSSIGNSIKGVANIVGIGGIFTAGAFGLGELTKEARLGQKSLSDYRIALLQATGDQGKANRAFAEGEGIIVSLSDKYKRSGGDLRGVLTQVAGLAGTIGQSSGDIAELGLAFEQLGVPAKALNAILRSSADPESLNALESLKSKFPALASVIEGVSDPAEKMNAILQAVQPTLKGMQDAADGPLGKMQALKVAAGDLKESLGGVVSEGAQPFAPIMGTIADVLNSTVTPAIAQVNSFLGENQSVLQIAAGGYQVLKVAMQIKDAGGLVKFIGEQTKAITGGATAILTKYIPGLAAKTAAETATATASTGAAVAAQGLGRAMTVALGPVGLIIAGLTIGVALFAAFSEKTKDLGEATADFKDAQANVDAALQNKSAVNEKSAQLNSLSDTYDALAGKPTRTAEEEKKLADVTAELAKEMPQAVQSFNKLNEAGEKTGKTTVVMTDAVRALTEENDKLAKQKSDETLKRLEEKGRALANSYKAAKEEQSELRVETAALTAATDAGFKGAKVGGFLGIGARDLGETLDKLAEINKKIEEGEPELQRLIKSERERGLSVDEVAKKYKLSAAQVTELSGFIEESDEKTKAHVRTAAELAGEFDKASAATAKLVTQQVSAVAKLKREQKELQALARKGDADAKVRLAEVEALLKEQLEIGRAAVSDQQQDTKFKTESERLLGLANAKVIDRIALEKEVQKLLKSQVEVERLRQDAGKLTEASKSAISDQDKKGLEEVLKVINAELARYKVTNDSIRSNERIRKLLQDQADITKQILAVDTENIDKLKKLEDAYRAITQANIESGISFLNSIAGANDNFRLKLLALNTQISFTGSSVDQLRKDFEKKPNVEPVLDELDRVIEAVREGIDAGPLITDLENAVTEVNAQLKTIGADNTQFVSIKELLDLINKESTSRTDRAKTTSAELVRIEGEKASKIRQSFDALGIYIDAKGLSQIDSLRLQIQAETELYNQLRQAAIEANDKTELQRLDEEYAQNKLSLNAQLFQAEQDQQRGHIEKINAIVDAGFSAAFGVANQKFFQQIDKGFDSRENIAGAFAAGAIKALITIGEQMLAQFVAGEIFKALSTSSTVASMQIIQTAAAPAAFAVATATFGSAALAALGSLSLNFGLFKGVLGLAEGGVVGMPTSVMLGERFEDELVTPLKTAREVLKEEIAGVKAGMPSLSRNDMKQAFVEAMLEVPLRGEISDRGIAFSHKREAARRERRGAKRPQPPGSIKIGGFIR